MEKDVHKVEMQWDYLTPVNEAKKVLEGQEFKTSTMFLSDPEAKKQGMRLWAWKGEAEKIENIEEGPLIRITAGDKSLGEIFLSFGRAEEGKPRVSKKFTSLSNLLDWIRGNL